MIINLLEDFGEISLGEKSISNICINPKNIFAISEYWKADWDWTNYRDIEMGLNINGVTYPLYKENYGTTEDVKEIADEIHILYQKIINHMGPNI